ncbi:hypothetical protein ACFHYQ_06115 [Sphaerimonospora cavernae]|uniref:Uncharacterized protein n=1 Tax=Sphaerimonospora cavernae TaxID=1740611 RepID=A0ABV6U413_9ACTN
MRLSLKRARRSKVLTMLALPLLVLPSGFGTPAAASTSTSPADSIILTAEQQSRIARPTLVSIKAAAAKQGIPLEKAIATYVNEAAKNNTAATANWPDGPVSTPDVMIDDLSAVQLIDLQGMAEAEQIH